MRRLLALAFAVGLVTAPAGAGSPSAAGTWRRLPAAPIAPDAALTSVWTGREMLVFGRETRRAEDGAVLSSRNVAAAYDPTADRWRRLTPPAGPSGGFQGRYGSVWTGRELLVWGPFDAEGFDPRTHRWRKLPRSPLDGRAPGVIVWTGRELIGWGGGCCGDAFSDGAAYRPATNRWRRLPRAPLAGGQSPTGAWTGRELVVFGVRRPDGPPLRSAAAYNPATNSWRRIAPLPAPRYGANAVWDGREVLVVAGAGGSELARAGFAYDPATNRWRSLPRADSQGRTGAAAVWTGRRLLLWGGQRAYGEIPAHGLAFDPRRGRWSALPRAPVSGRADPAAVWTGRELIVWGGGRMYPPFTDGAAFRPGSG